jgi:hypothetical protein
MRVAFVSVGLLAFTGCAAQTAVQVGGHEQSAWVWTNNGSRYSDPFIYRCKEFPGHDVVCIKARVVEAQPAGAAVPVATPTPAPTPAPTP